jgi:hypothetical protein
MDEPGKTITFKPHELRFLKLNTPGDSGVMGGYQRMENYLLEHVSTLGEVYLDVKLLERLVRYCMNYGSGGPNGRLRNACIPALRRIGIECLPGWNR